MTFVHSKSQTTGISITRDFFVIKQEDSWQKTAAKISLWVSCAFCIGLFIALGTLLADLYRNHSTKSLSMPPMTKFELPPAKLIEPAPITASAPNIWTRTKKISLIVGSILLVGSLSYLAYRYFTSPVQKNTPQAFLTFTAQALPASTPSTLAVATNSTTTPVLDLCPCIEKESVSTAPFIPSTNQSLTVINPPQTSATHFKQSLSNQFISNPEATDFTQTLMLEHPWIKVLPIPDQKHQELMTLNRSNYHCPQKTSPPQPVLNPEKGPETTGRRIIITFLKNWLFN